MASLEVVYDQVSIYGLHALHLISTQPIDFEEQVAQRVGDGKLETWLAYEEKELRLHHLRLYWRAPGAGQWTVSMLQKYQENGGKFNGSK